MANSTAVIGLTYRATSIQNPFGDAAGMFFEITKGLSEPPAVRGGDIVVPGLAGYIQGTRVKAGVKVGLEGIIWGATGATATTTFRTQVDTFRALFDPTIAGSLVATLEDGVTTRTLTNARTLPTVIWDTQTPWFARVSIELESPAGDWV